MLPPTMETVAFAPNLQIEHSYDCDKQLLAILHLLNSIFRTTRDKNLLCNLVVDLETHS